MCGPEPQNSSNHGGCMTHREGCVFFSLLAMFIFIIASGFVGDLYSNDASEFNGYQLNIPWKICKAGYVELAVCKICEKNKNIGCDYYSCLNSYANYEWVLNSQKHHSTVKYDTQILINTSLPIDYSSSQAKIDSLNGTNGIGFYNPTANLFYPNYDEYYSKSNNNYLELRAFIILVSFVGLFASYPIFFLIQFINRACCRGFGVVAPSGYLSLEQDVSAGGSTLSCAHDGIQ